MNRLPVPANWKIEYPDVVAAEYYFVSGDFKLEDGTVERVVLKLPQSEGCKSIKNKTLFRKSAQDPFSSQKNTKYISPQMIMQFTNYY
jgi:hypothetical protein